MITKNTNRMTDGAAVNVLDFGAVGDGVTDDAAALLAALNAASGKVLDGGGATYRADSKILTTAENITVQNMTIDFSNAPDQVAGGVDRMLEFSGSAGTPQLLLADRVRGDFTLQVPSTADFSVDQWCILESDAIFETGQTVTLGQYVCIKSIDNATQVSLHNDLLYSFDTADNAQLVPITMKKNITFRDVNFIGADDFRQAALVFERCQDVTVDNCKFRDIDYTAVIASRCVNFSSSDCTVRNANLTGNSYGYGIHNGSYGVTIVNGYGEDLRHFVTIGDNEGVCLFVNVTNCHVTACRDAGIDAHAAADFVNFSGNTIEGSAFDSGQLDGIIFQGLNCIMNDNVVVGIRRHAIFHQVLPDIAASKVGKASAIISGNLVVNHGGGDATESGVIYQHDSAGGETGSVIIANNTIRGGSDVGIQVYAIGSSISNVNVSNNTVEDSAIRACLIRGAAGATVDNVVVNGNLLNCSAGPSGQGIYLLGVSTGEITNTIVSNNSIRGNMAYGVRASFSDYLNVNGNILRGYSSAATFYNDTTNNVESNNLV